MDINPLIRREMRGELLREFVKEAATFGSTAEETIASLVDMAATIYAVELSGADTDKQMQAARQAVNTACASAIDELPSARKDAFFANLLRDRGFS